MSNFGSDFGPNSHLFDDDEESEATRIFLAEQKLKFEKMFPLPKDYKKPPQPKTPGLKTVNKAVFDDTIDHGKSKIGFGAELFEAKEEARVLRVRLKNAIEHNDILKKNEKENSEKMNALIDEIAALKKQMNDVKREHDESFNQSSVVQSMTSSELDQYKRISMKLHNWRKFDQSQLDFMKEVLQEKGLWTKELRHKIHHSYKQIQPVNLEDDEADKLFSGSVLDYQGIDGVEEEEEDMQIEETVAIPYNDTFSALGIAPLKFKEDSAEVAGPATSSATTRLADPNLEESAITNKTSLRADMDISVIGNDMNEENDVSQTSVCDTTIGPNYSSIDYEIYEKIERLEVENCNLKSQLQIAQHKSKSAMLYQEQKLDLETKNTYLNKQLDLTMNELCALRDATSRGIFSSMDGADRVEQAKNITDRVVKLQQENEKLSKTVADLEESLNLLKADRDDLEETFAEEKKEKDVLNTEYLLQQKHLREKDLEVVDLKARCSELQNSVDLLKVELAERSKKIDVLQEELSMARITAPTDAGDTTQIFHMKLNPLELAREEMKEREKEEEEKSRKRKMSQNSDESECGDPDAKRAKDERVVALEEQLRRAEHAKLKAVEIQTSLALRYREVSTALTGYQIKMRNEEWKVTPVNGSEPEDSFTFKYENGQLMLVSRDDHSTDAAVLKWKKAMDRFIGHFQSVPAFLSKVTLSLLEDQHVMEECQPSMSVLHED